MRLTTKKIVSLIYCLLLFFSSTHHTWSKSVEQQAVLAVLTFNVASFTSWPEQGHNNEKSTLSLCVYGSNMVQQAFESIANKVVNNRTIQIVNLSRLRDLNQCQLLYMSELERKKLVPLLIELKDLPILTVGENMNFLRAGGMVSLENINGTMQLTFNLPVINNSELVIGSRLLNLANIVDFPMQSE